MVKKRIRAGHKAVITKRLTEATGILEPEVEGRGEPDLLQLAQHKLTLTEKLKF